MEGSRRAVRSTAGPPGARTETVHATLAAAKLAFSLAPVAVKAIDPAPPTSHR
jgi:hypothetical protein